MALGAKQGDLQKLATYTNHHHPQPLSRLGLGLVLKVLLEAADDSPICWCRDGVASTSNLMLLGHGSSLPNVLPSAGSISKNVGFYK